MHAEFSTSNLLARNDLSDGRFLLTEAQLRLDTNLRSFSHEASDASNLLAMLAGTFAYRLTKVAVLSAPCARFNKWMAPALGVLSEVASYRTVNSILSKEAASHFTHSWLGDFVTFSSLRVFGSLTRGQNVLWGHSLQSLGMVAAHQLTYAMQLSAKPAGNFFEQVLEAERSNLALAVGHALMATLTGNRLTQKETLLDLRANTIQAGVVRQNLPSLRAQSAVMAQASSPFPAFSVLMSVYARENPAFFSEALRSVVEQSLVPDEIVLVADGPLTPALEQVIQHWQARLQKGLKLVRLEKNVGTGIALRTGVENCSHEIVARMDSDDISRRDRFEKQVGFLMRHPEIDVVGTWIDEFETRTGTHSRRIRKLPASSDAIRRMSIHRSPVNHVTAVFRRSSVLKVGNYQDFKGMEDYHLWIRMLLQGSRFHNMQESLVDVRAGEEMYARRGGWDLFKNDAKFQFFLWDLGYVDAGQLLINLGKRGILRFAPEKMRAYIYKYILRQASESQFFRTKVSLKEQPSQGIAENKSRR